MALGEYSEYSNLTPLESPPTDIHYTLRTFPEVGNHPGSRAAATPSGARGEADWSVRVTADGEAVVLGKLTFSRGCTEEIDALLLN